MKPSHIAATLCLAGAAGAPFAASAAELELIPMLGIADLGADDPDIDYDAGFALGVSFGGRLAQIFSLHGQIQIHPLSVEDQPGVDASGALVTAQLAGLFHFHLVDNDSLDLMLGPVLGGFSMSEEAEGGGDSASISVSGVLVGLYAGLFFDLGPSIALGPSVQYSQMYASEVCVEFNGDSLCREVDDDEGLNLLLVQLGLKIDF